MSGSNSSLFDSANIESTLTYPPYVAEQYNPATGYNLWPTGNGMTLAQLISAVYTETNRPDLIPETLQSIMESVLTLHSAEFYFKDLVETRVQFNNPTSFLQTLDTRAIPYFRSMAYIRKTDPSVWQPEQYGGLYPNNFSEPRKGFDFLKRRDIGKILDSFGYEEQDIWYQAGNQINMKSSTELAWATIGYYKYPTLDPTGKVFNSWIAAEYPYAIVYRATGMVFAKIGEDKSYAMYMTKPVPGRGNDTGGLFYQQLDQLQKNSVVAEGW
jgi:hypothetical protein